MKRARMRVERMMNRTRSNRKMTVPIVINPENLCGLTASKRAMPPVLIVSVNQLIRVR